MDRKYSKNNLTILVETLVETLIEILLRGCMTPVTRKVNYFRKFFKGRKVFKKFIDSILLILQSLIKMLLVLINREIIQLSIEKSILKNSKRPSKILKNILSTVEKNHASRKTRKFERKNKINIFSFWRINWTWLIYNFLEFNKP